MGFSTAAVMGEAIYLGHNLSVFKVGAGAPEMSIAVAPPASASSTIARHLNFPNDLARAVRYSRDREAFGSPQVNGLYLGTHQER
jgi:hypothetical protein